MYVPNYRPQHKCIKQEDSKAGRAEEGEYNHHSLII